MLLYKTICVVVLLTFVDSARILGVFPVPSISHQFVFRALTKELARRGHELVVITPNPAYPKERPPDNITEIDTSYSYQVMAQMQNDPSIYLRGVVMKEDVMFTPDVYKVTVDNYVSQLNHPEFKKLVEDKTQKFDLILLENILNYHMIVTTIFKAPAILISSFHGKPESYEIVGANNHPILYPNVFSYQTMENLTLLDKIQAVNQKYKYMKTMKEVEDYENQLLKTNFGPDAPTVKELKDNIDFVFINSHEVFCDNRPVPPNVAFVGPLHLQPPKELPQDLKLYLDNSKTGVIYVSLGTNVIPTNMDVEMLNSFLDAFEALPYDILWKFNGENLKRIPRNVKIQKWFPQRDLLVHPNIKLFVMQGGLQSTDEAIDSGVPLVTIPLLADQFFNANKHEKLGIGVMINPLTLDKEKLLQGINKVLNDESYKINIRKLKKIVNDHPLSAMERAVWWTEYVIRHGGARHLRSPAANISWSEYFMSDVIIAVATFSLASLLIVVLLIKFILNFFKGIPSDQKLKQK